MFDTLPGQLAKRGYNVEVVGYTRDRERIITSEDKSIQFNFVDAISISIPNFVAEFPYFLNFEKIIEQRQPDLIHINTLPFLTSIQSVRIAKKLGMPSILHVHGVIGIYNKILDFAQYAFIRTLLRTAFHDATLVICLTKNDAFEVQKFGCPYRKIRIIPNGVDVERFSPRRHLVNNLIFWGGRFIKQKGLEYLIRAMHIIVKTKPSIKLVMTGDGPLFPKISNMIKKFNLTKNVIFWGFVHREKLPSIISSCSICVLPSLKEGMPFMLLEAMACGRPVIGSDIPGINDVISHGENGILVPPKNSEALADAIMLLMENKELRNRLGRNARQFVIKNYSWDVITEKIEIVYNEAMQEVK